MAFPIMIERSHSATERVLHFREEISLCPARYLARHDNLADKNLTGGFKPETIELVRWLFQLPGITKVIVTPYFVIITRAELHNWGELFPQILSELPRFFNRGDIELSFRAKSGEVTAMQDPATEILEMVYALSPDDGPDN